MALETQRQPALPMGSDAGNKHLEAQAASTALYMKGGSQSKTGHEFLDSNHRLSSAGAATSLKYANPQDLPSFPSRGLKTTDSAAGAAASLGWANQKPFTHWKPDPSSSASVAAMRAKDYKMAPLWQPEQSAHGAKAAVLAHKGPQKVGAYQPEASEWGNSAALSAFKKYGAGELSPVLDYGYNGPGRRGSLLAASGAMNGRRRAESSPVALQKVETYPDEKNAGTNALRAAESASKKQKGSVEQGAIPYTSMTRQMYTSHPPVALEVEEAERQGTLHASAVAMAKNMYTQQQKQFEAVSDAPRGRHSRRFSASTSSDEVVPPNRYSNLQAAAQKLAQERLAKLHDEHAQHREYRDYYAAPRTLSKYTGRGRARRRAASDGSLDQDKEQSNRIRAQMNKFSTEVSEVDAKRKKDREALIAAAQRNVTKKLHGMDERVFADTGKVPPSLLSEWEVKAHAAAQEKSVNRRENYGKVHVGGGKFVNQSEVDQVAQKNVQPVLDEIQEKAEAERERQAVLKAEQENEARKNAEKKARDRECKELNKKLKHQEKEAEKARKSEEKSARKEESRLAKEKRKSAKYEHAHTQPTTAASGVHETAGEPEESATAEPTRYTEEPATERFAAAEEVSTKPTVSQPTAATGGATGILNIGNKPPRAAPHPPTSNEPEVSYLRTSMEDDASVRMREIAVRATADDEHDGKMKKWFKNRFSRRLSRASEKPSEQPIEKAVERPVEKPAELAAEKPMNERYAGGAALSDANVNDSVASLERPASARDVALAGKGKGKERESIPAQGEIVAESSDHCILEDLKAPTQNGIKDTDDGIQEASDSFDESLVAPPAFPAVKEASPVRDSRFIEEI